MCGTSVPAVSALCTLVLLEAKPDPGPVTRVTGGLPRIGRLRRLCPTHRARRPRLMKADRGTGILALTCPVCLCDVCVHCTPGLLLHHPVREWEGAISILVESRAGLLKEGAD